ncbi:hypothetical protein B0J15DRAFT_98327 [Fusarium solani]|uniref:Uncharacterized protein n=1 Tax=Fusarium solani TaxID=169388 RepID=A0A9P9RCU0_FUSSL|nr:uncharacterized protein B0J15DRAFT_98327 [Fusarium solani]KAH7273370.1 hypothetical protein B0J15DRAFT_98327 [Fusarium solani]
MYSKYHNAVHFPILVIARALVTAIPMSKPDLDGFHMDHTSLTSHIFILRCVHIVASLAHCNICRPQASVVNYDFHALHHVWDPKIRGSFLQGPGKR